MESYTTLSVRDDSEVVTEVRRRREADDATTTEVLEELLTQAGEN